MLKTISGFSQSYFVTGTLVVMLSWIMTGCQLGSNDIEFAGGVDNGTGYYTHEAQSLNLCSNYIDGSAQTCGAVATSLIPYYISDTMINPTAFIYQEVSGTNINGFLLDVNNDASQKALTFNTSTQEFEYSGYTDLYDFWNSTTCQAKYTIDFDGGLSQETPSDMDGTTIRGRVALNAEVSVHVTEVVPGGCAAPLQEAEDCYKSNAGGATCANAVNAIDVFYYNHITYFTNGGIFTADDVSNVQSMTYDVHYQ